MNSRSTLSIVTNDRSRRRLPIQPHNFVIADRVVLKCVMSTGWHVAGACYDLPITARHTISTCARLAAVVAARVPVGGHPSDTPIVRAHCPDRLNRLLAECGKCCRRQYRTKVWVLKIGTHERRHLKNEHRKRTAAFRIMAVFAWCG